ncbi:MAG: hypothetical protein M5U09_13495 [Gammaproteobacteria bacterium]|nr:hypothetical protein [Gammaproteobacteria bacterium]
MRFYAIDAHGPDLECLKTAIATAVTIARNLACGITLLVPDLERANRTVLVDALGDRFLTRLREARPATLLGQPIKLHTADSVNPFNEKGVLVVLWGNRTMLKRAAQCRRCKATICPALFPGELGNWVAKNDATVLMGSRTLPASQST